MFASIVSKITSAVVTGIRAIGAVLSRVHWLVPAIAVAALIFFA